MLSNLNTWSFAETVNKLNFIRHSSNKIVVVKTVLIRTVLYYYRLEISGINLKIADQNGQNNSWDNSEKIVSVSEIIIILCNFVKQNKLLIAGQNLLFLMDYAILSKEDLKENSKTFSRASIVIPLLKNT